MGAADGRSAELTGFLIDHKADVNARALANDWPSQLTGEPRNQYRPTGGLTPLLYAARSGCTDCVHALLDAGADPNRPNPDGVTPLMVAIDNFAFDPAKLPFAPGANPTPSDGGGLGMEPSPRCNPSANDAQDRSIATLEILSAGGADVNARIIDVKSRTARMGRGSTLPERGGQSALFGAVQWAWPRVVQYLIDHGAEVAIVDDRRVSPLDAAFGRASSIDNRPSPAAAPLPPTAIAPQTH